ncbi:hypothetical protein C1H46_000654 [Malus baccata]|uniref:Uncharacterized protein n=1 Tax=Malus baccata TaxID=106549 RepID=A0A540NRI7_MALBA|nr:hypothetical protein C1H46_000654 [Malus baccata]
MLPDHPKPITQIDATSPTKQHHRYDTKRYLVSQPRMLHQSQPENEISPWENYGQHYQQRQTERRRWCCKHLTRCNRNLTHLLERAQQNALKADSRPKRKGSKKMNAQKVYQIG